MKKRNITVVLCTLLIVQAIPSFTTASAVTINNAPAVSTVESNDLLTKSSEALSSSNSSSLTLAQKRQAIVNEAKKCLKKPYVWGTEGPDSFDCSGLTYYVYKTALGINITRTTSTQVKQGEAVSKEDLLPGDLVFPSNHHVQIYIGNGKVIHAPQTGELVKISNLGTVWKARRIIYKK